MFDKDDNHEIMLLLIF